jgi:hypothetical protein
VIWLSWRQFRTQAIVVFGALAVFALVLIATGLRLRHWYDTSGIATCGTASECETVRGVFLAHYKQLQTLSKILLLLLPAVTGVFWGAPLVARELDTGTFRLAWTQSITRTRWMTGKIIVVGLASVAASGVLSLMVTWWFSPIDRLANNRFDTDVFDTRNIAPLGSAAFGFALGVVAGLLIRRTLPAMAVTLVGFLGTRLAMVTWVRPNLATPLHASGALAPPPAVGGAKALRVDPMTSPGDWIISQTLIDPSGHPTHTIRFNPGDACAVTRTCLNGYRQAVTYQPADRYWPFQWYETAILAGTALVLIGFAFWWLRRRLA